MFLSYRRRNKKDWQRTELAQLFKSTLTIVLVLRERGETVCCVCMVDCGSPFLDPCSLTDKCEQPITVDTV
jgi:hypothetical protein